MCVCRLSGHRPLTNIAYSEYLEADQINQQAIVHVSFKLYTNVCCDCMHVRPTMHIFALNKNIPLVPTHHHVSESL